MLKSYSTTLVLRVRMPISDDLAPRNFITKIVRYDRVVNVPNSMTVLEEMMPASVAMSEAKLCGIYNFCNPGAVSHNEILDMYKEIVDPTFVYENFTIEEQNKILEAKRSNNELDATKLMAALEDCGVHINEIHEACRLCITRMRDGLIAEHGEDYKDKLPKKLSQS